MRRIALPVALLAGIAVLLATTVTAAAAGPKQSTGTTVALTSTSCTFTATASWTRNDVQHVILRLLKSERWSTIGNGQEAVVDLAAKTASASWTLGSAGALPGQFSAEVDLRTAAGAEGQVLEQRRSSTKIRATCVLTRN